MSTKIQAALVAAMRDICGKGIAKLDRNKAQGYNFRGIEAAMNELSPILINHGITVTPRYSELTIQERAKVDEGKALRFVTLKGAFTFAADDGSNVVSECYGEAMDSGDKAVIKAQSVAFRTALFQQFVVPTMAMDTELEGADGSEGEMLDLFREAAMGGSSALNAYWKANKPPADFWKRHGDSLKAAAAAADKEAA